MTVREAFAKFARKTSTIIGTPYAFALAVCFILLWAVAGPFMGFTERWQLIVNTGTTIVTFLVVFLIQTTQNKDSRALHLKLDELIHVISKARNKLIDCEELSDRELAELEEEFRRMGRVSDRDEQSRDDNNVEIEDVSAAERGEPKLVRAHPRLVPRN